MENYQFDRLVQIMPCPDRDKCGAYLLSPFPYGTQRGCIGQRKWCGMNFKNDERSANQNDKERI